MINTRIRRWAAIFVLAALAFVQASLALSACSMDRGMLAGAMAMSPGEPCGTCNAPKQVAMDNANVCVAHYTADLQQVPYAVVIAPALVPMRVLWVSQPPGPPSPSKGLTARPPGAPPHRVLLHSFLI
ncbi:MAG: hypothetical protein WAO95_07525 [Burkholderiales bacterium]